MSNSRQSNGLAFWVIVLSIDREESMYRKALSRGGLKVGGMLELEDSEGFIQAGQPI